MRMSIPTQSDEVPNSIVHLEFALDMASPAAAPAGALHTPDQLLLAIRQELLPAVDTTVALAAGQSADVTIPALEIDLGNFENPPDWNSVRNRLAKALLASLAPYLQGHASSPPAASPVNGPLWRQDPLQALADAPIPFARHGNALSAGVDQGKTALVPSVMPPDQAAAPLNADDTRAAARPAAFDHDHRAWQAQALAQLGKVTGITPQQDAVARLFRQEGAASRVPRRGFDAVELQRWSAGQQSRARALTAALTEQQIRDVMTALVPENATELRTALADLDHAAEPVAARHAAAVALLVRGAVDLESIRNARPSLSSRARPLLARLFAAAGLDAQLAAELAVNVGQAQSQPTEPDRGSLQNLAAYTSGRTAGQGQDPLAQTGLAETKGAARVRYTHTPTDRQQNQSDGAGDHPKKPAPSERDTTGPIRTSVAEKTDQSAASQRAKPWQEPQPTTGAEGSEGRMKNMHVGPTDVAPAKTNAAAIRTPAVDHGLSQRPVPASDQTWEPADRTTSDSPPPTEQPTRPAGDTDHPQTSAPPHGTHGAASQGRGAAKADSPAPAPPGHAADIQGSHTASDGSEHTRQDSTLGSAGHDPTPSPDNDGADSQKAPRAPARSLELQDARTSGRVTGNRSLAPDLEQAAPENDPPLASTPADGPRSASGGRYFSRPADEDPAGARAMRQGRDASPQQAAATAPQLRADGSGAVDNPVGPNPHDTDCFIVAARAEQQLEDLLRNLLGQRAMPLARLMELVQSVIDKDRAQTDESRAAFWVAALAASAHGGDDDQRVMSGFVQALLPEKGACRHRLGMAIARLGHAAAGVDNDVRIAARTALEKILSDDVQSPPSAFPKTPARNCQPPTAEPGHRLLTRQSGLVLFHPYLAMLFDRLEIRRDDRGLLPADKPRAIAALNWLVTGKAGPDTRPDPLLRCLLGLPVPAVLPDAAELTPDATDLVDGLIAAVITQWGRLGKTSPDGLRAAFVLRDGLFDPDPGAPRLTVNAGPYDMLLDGLPWAINLVALPWMDAPLSVKWRQRDG